MGPVCVLSRAGDLTDHKKLCASNWRSSGGDPCFVLLLQEQLFVEFDQSCCHSCGMRKCLRGDVDSGQVLDFVSGPLLEDGCLLFAVCSEIPTLYVLPSPTRGYRGYVFRD